MTSEEENKNREDSEDDEEGSETASVASTKFSYYSINSTNSEKSRKQARLSNYAFCIQVLILCLGDIGVIGKQLRIYGLGNVRIP